MNNQKRAPSKRQDRRGAVFVLTVFCLFFVSAFLAFAADWGFIILVESDLQNAADSAALSGARALPRGRAAAIAAATAYAGKNVAGGRKVVLWSNEDVEIGVWDDQRLQFTVLEENSSEEPNAVRITCRRTATRGNALNLFFARVIGTASADLSASAVATCLPPATAFRFLIDDEMFDTDVPAIEQLAGSLGKTPDDLLRDGNKDGFIDLPGGSVLELPTGQVGDEGLFDTESYAGAFPFSDNTHYTFLDFLAHDTALRNILGTQRLNDIEWTSSNAPHRDLVGKKVLDPVPGVDPANSHQKVMDLPNADMVHVSPIFKSDVGMQERDPSKYGSPTANLQGERRGLVAFRILSARSNPAGGSYLPLLTVEIVDPSKIVVEDIRRGVGAAAGPRVKLVK